MKAAFFHDSIFVKKSNFYYTTGTLNNDLFSFYLKYFDKITIVTRFKNYNNTLQKYINKVNLINNNKVKFNCVSSYKNAYKHIKEEIKNCDIAIIRCHSFIGTIAYYYAKKYNKKYIVESVSCAFDCLWYHSFVGKFIAPIMYIFTKKIIKDAFAVTYVSEKFLQKRYPNNRKSLSCSDVNLEELQVISKKDINKKYSNILKRNIRIANIANLNMKYKGQHYLILAINELLKKGYNIELSLVGGGSGIKLKKLVKKLNIEHNVKFVGVLPHNEIFDFLKENDIYVQPSNAESHGRVIVEAMSVGCPVIGSNVGGIPELIDSKYVFKKKNWLDLANKIELMINSNVCESSLYCFNKSKEYQKNKLYIKKTKFYKEIMEELSND